MDWTIGNCSCCGFDDVEVLQLARGPETLHLRLASICRICAELGLRCDTPTYNAEPASRRDLSVAVRLLLGDRAR